MRVMIKLRVRELAEEKGVSLAQFQRETGLPPATARRLFYSDSRGAHRLPGTPPRTPLESIDFRNLEILARYFEVQLGDLLEILD